MKNWLAGGVALVVAVALALPNVADAKRLSGGKNAGMQRSAPTQQAPNSAQGTPAQQAAPQAPAPSPAAAPAAAGATATAAAAAAPAKRSWMGPIAGLAAGLGLAALASYLGFGEALANFLMIALLAIAAIFLVRFLMRRFASPARSEPALAGAGAAGGPANVPMGAQREEPVAAAAQAPMARSALQPAATGEVSVTGRPLTAMGATQEVEQPAAAAVSLAAPRTGPQLPEGFDLPAFERVAKMIFIRLQAANDRADLDDLRQFTTPELFASLRLDLQDRGSAAQTTDVERVDAQVVDFATEDGREIVSVRFHGLIREEAGQPAAAFDEIWHLVRPASGGNWAIAGIQQTN
jgi:predicted lipid-binding transport protein (Tim44 family)